MFITLESNGMRCIYALNVIVSENIKNGLYVNYNKIGNDIKISLQNELYQFVSVFRDTE